MARSVATRVLQVSYDLGLHRRLSELVDPLAQQAEMEVLRQGYRQADIRFAVKLHLRSASGGPEIAVDAIQFDRNYDFDAEVERWKNSKSTGYQRYSEMPADAPFRVHGKSMGYFLGLLPRMVFGRRFEEQTGDKAPKELILERVSVEASAERSDR